MLPELTVTRTADLLLARTLKLNASHQQFHRTPTACGTFQVTRAKRSSASTQHQRNACATQLAHGTSTLANARPLCAHSTTLSQCACKLSIPALVILAANTSTVVANDVAASSRTPQLAQPTRSATGIQAACQTLLGLQNASSSARLRTPSKAAA